MLRSLLLATAATSLLAGLAPAFAADLPVEQPTPVIEPAPVIGGFYIGTVSGADFQNHNSFNVNNAVLGGGANVRNDYEIGYYAGGVAGFALAPIYGLSPRVEAEVGFGDESVDTHTINSPTLNNVKQSAFNSFGEMQSIQGYGNLYLDLDVSNFVGNTGFLAAFRPYIGGGAGIANVQLKKQGISATGTLIDDDDTDFAYHLDAGVGIDVSKFGIFGDGSFLNGTVLNVGYRFTDAPDLTFTAGDGTKSTTSMRSNMLLVSTRKLF